MSQTPGPRRAAPERVARGVLRRFARRPAAPVLALLALNAVVSFSGRASARGDAPAVAPRPPAGTARERAERFASAARAGNGVRQAPVREAAVAPLALAGPSWSITAIPPTAGRDRTRAYGIDAQGRVAARASSFSDAEQKEVDREALVWSAADGSVALPSLAGESGAWGINDAGQLSGWALASDAASRGVRWSAGSAPATLAGIGTLSNATTGVAGATSTAYGINAAGLVAGSSDIPNDDGTFAPFHAVVWDEAGGLRDLGTFDTSYPQWQHGYSIAYDANASGQVVGTASSSEGGTWHFRPFLWDAAGGLRELPRDPAWADPAREWYAVAINDTGLVGGHVIVASGQSLPYYWASPSASPVAMPMTAEYPWGEVYGVNAHGLMVGILWNDGGAERAFAFEPVLGMRNLDALVDPSEGWVLQFARDVNDAGRIVGSGTHVGAARGFLLAPPAPVLDPLPAPLVVGGSATLAGGGFSAGSVVLLHVATATGAVTHGPFAPATVTPTTLAWEIPASVPPGNGFGTVQVVNTDQGYPVSNAVAALLHGDAEDGLPTILTINGVALSPPDPSIPGAHVETVLAAGSTVTITGTGFVGPLVNLYTATGNIGPLTPLPGGTSLSFQVVVPADAPAGPGTFQVVNSGAGWTVSNAVDAVMRARITVTSVSVNGSLVTVTGDGFCALTVINLFNVQGGNVVNLGGLNPDGTPVIPLSNVTVTSFTFALPAGAQPGAAYVQALNPPFTPYTSSGTDPGGAFNIP